MKELEPDWGWYRHRVRVRLARAYKTTFHWSFIDIVATFVMSYQAVAQPRALSCDNIKRPDSNNMDLTTTAADVSPSSLVFLWWHWVSSVQSTGWPISSPCYLWLLHCARDLIKCFQSLCSSWSVLRKVKANIWLSNEQCKLNLEASCGVIFEHWKQKR